MAMPSTIKINLDQIREILMFTDFYRKNTYNQEQSDNNFPSCRLIWKQHILFVKLSEQQRGHDLPSISNKNWLADCLKHSKIRAVRIDPLLGEKYIKVWAEACHQANKSIFLWIPPLKKYPTQKELQAKKLKQLITKGSVIAVLMLLSPLLLGSIVIILISSPGILINHDLTVGERGKLFHNYKFSKSKKWMRKSGLELLPKLINLINGEISIFGPAPKLLNEAVKLTGDQQLQLNILPGITGQTRRTITDEYQLNL